MASNAEGKKGKHSHEKIIGQLWRKIELVKAILNLKYESSVDLVESVLLKMQEEPDWWDELPDSIKESYATGLKEMEKGKEIDVEVFLKKYK